MLYYVDRSYEQKIKEFVPKIPNATMQGENETIERICLCPTIEDCIYAASWGHSNISYRNINEVFRVYEFDENDICKKNIINSDELWSKQLVPDAYITNEIWVIKQILKPKNIFYIRIGEYFDTKIIPILTKEEFIMEEEGKEIDYSNIYYWEIVCDLEIIKLKEKSLNFSKIIKIPNYICSNYRIIEDFIAKETFYEVSNDNEYTYFEFNKPQMFDYELLLQYFENKEGEYYAERVL